MFQLRQQGVSMSGPDKTVLEPGDISIAATHLVYVSPGTGSDVTGDGSEFKPYATIAKAYATITTASIATFFAVILLPGTYVENVPLKPFIAVIGVDKQLVDVQGNWTLGAGFADPAVGQVAWVTNVGVNGLLTLNYVVANSSAGFVVFQDCLILGNVTLTQGVSNDTDFYDCDLQADYTQTGGNAFFFNTNGTIDIAQLTLLGPGTLRAVGGSWAGSVTADQNLDDTGVCEIVSEGFSMSRGAALVVATAANSPTIGANYGDLPENVSISGGAAAVMTPQMRVSHQFPNIAPNPTAIGATGTTTISLPYPAGLFGATPIEGCHMVATMVGSNWGAIVGVLAVSVTITFRSNAGVPTCDVNFYNPGVGFNITDQIDLNTSGYLPLVL